MMDERKRALEDAAALVDGYAEFWATQPKKGFFAEELRRIANEIRQDPGIRITAIAAVEGKGRGHE